MWEGVIWPEPCLHANTRLGHKDMNPATWGVVLHLFRRLWPNLPRNLSTYGQFLSSLQRV